MNNNMQEKEAFLCALTSLLSEINVWNSLQKQLFSIILMLIIEQNYTNVIILEDSSVYYKLNLEKDNERIKSEYFLRDNLEEMSKARIRIRNLKTNKWGFVSVIEEAFGDTQSTTVILSESFVKMLKTLSNLEDYYTNPQLINVLSNKSEIKKEYAKRFFIDLQKLKTEKSTESINRKITYYIPDLLALFEIQEDAFIVKKTGVFDCKRFEKEVLTPVTQHINTSEQIYFKSISPHNEIFFKNVKDGRKTIGYEFDVTIRPLKDIISNRRWLLSLTNNSLFDDNELIYGVEIDKNWNNS